jgi:hypothetical protein
VKQHLSDAEIEQQFDLGYHFKHVDITFKRVFGERRSTRILGIGAREESPSPDLLPARAGRGRS